MIRCNNIEDLRKALETISKGEFLLANISTLMQAFAENMFVNKKNNRKATDSPWNKDNYQNFFDNVEEEAIEFSSKTNTETYIGMMEFIDFVKTDEGYAIDDGNHRREAMLEVYNFDMPQRFKNKATPNSFLNKIIDTQKEECYPEEIQNILNNCYIPIRCTNGSAKRYVGKNSAKTMASQQKNRVLYTGNKVFDKISETTENNIFALCANNCSKEETSAMDTIAFLGYLGGDHKSSKTNTAPYILDKYTDENSQKKLIHLANQLVETIQMHYLDEFSFAFNGWKFRNAYMYGLLKIAKEHVVAQKCKQFNMTAKALRKQILNDKNLFFEVVETAINLLNNKRFLKSLNSSETKKILNMVIIAKDGTGQFSSGDAIYNALITTVNNPLI